MFCLLVNLLHRLEHTVIVVCHQRVDLIHLQFLQHAVEVEVIELKEEVGSHEIGEFLIVVLLIDIEQLIIV